MNWYWWVLIVVGAPFGAAVAGVLLAMGAYGLFLVLGMWPAVVLGAFRGQNPFRIMEDWLERVLP